MRRLLRAGVARRCHTHHTAHTHSPTEGKLKEVVCIPKDAPGRPPDATIHGRHATKFRFSSRPFKRIWNWEKHAKSAQKRPFTASSQQQMGTRSFASIMASQVRTSPVFPPATAPRSIALHSCRGLSTGKSDWSLRHGPHDLSRRPHHGDWHELIFSTWHHPPQLVLVVLFSIFLFWYITNTVRMIFHPDNHFHRRDRRKHDWERDIDTDRVKKYHNHPLRRWTERYGVPGVVFPQLDEKVAGEDWHKDMHNRISDHEPRPKSGWLIP